MLTYDSLVQEALKAVPAFAKEYRRLISEDIIDYEDGNHIVFGYAFTPILITAMKNHDETVVRSMFDFLEQMASSDDGLVVEVCDQSVLEALNDEYDLNKIRFLMGPKTQEGADAVKQYMY